MKILSLKEVVLLTGLSKVTLWRLEQKNMFPQRVALSPRRVGWKHDEVMEWLDTRPRVTAAETINTEGFENA